MNQRTARLLRREAFRLATGPADNRATRRSLKRAWNQTQRPERHTLRKSLS